MKKVLVLLTALVYLFSLIGCYVRIPENPETDLEFWIQENMDGFDFSGMRERYGIMGGREYYGSGYFPTVNENGEQIDPDECVIYTITSYPDYSDNEQHITRITITDPAVNIYGLCAASSLEEFDALFESLDYEIEEIGRGEGSISVKANRLVEAANRNGGKDNIAVVLVQLVFDGE